MGVAVQKFTTQDAQQGIANIIAERNAFENQLAVVKQQNAELVTELQQQVERLEKLKDFEPLLEVDTAYLQVDLRDSAVIRQLRATCIKLYKKRGDPVPIEDSKARQLARLNMSGVVQACIKYCMEPGIFRKVQARFL
jgi:hypothetical protein